MTVFARAVELGSFSAAGNAMNMSSQLVGKHVQQLEKHLGLQLIQRTTRKHHLTEAGHDFYERVKIILAEVEAAEGMAAQSRGMPRGKIKISAPVSFGIHALTPALSNFLDKYPDIQIELTLSNRRVDLIDEGVDIAFRAGELSDSGLIARPLQPYQLKLCASPAYLAKNADISHPLDLMQHRCLVFAHTEQRSRWIFDSPEGEIVVPVTGQLMVDNGEALLNAARNGLGVLLQPLELLAEDLATGRLVEVLPNYPLPYRKFHLLYAKDRRMTPKLSCFIEFALSQFGAAKPSL